jgi:hypothetical protein
MNKDLINNIYVRATDGFRADLSIGSVYSGILGDVRRLDKTIDSVAKLDNTLSKIYDIAQIKVEFLNEQELIIARKELTELLGLIVVDCFGRLLGFHIRWLLQSIGARLNKLEKLVDLLAPLNRESLIENLVEAGWEQVSMGREHYYKSSQREYYTTLSDTELLDLREEDEEDEEDEGDEGDEGEDLD